MSKTFTTLLIFFYFKFDLKGIIDKCTIIYIKSKDKKRISSTVHKCPVDVNRNPSSYVLFWSGNLQNKMRQYFSL